MQSDILNWRLQFQILNWRKGSIKFKIAPDSKLHSNGYTVSYCCYWDYSNKLKRLISSTFPGMSRQICLSKFNSLTFLLGVHNSVNDNLNKPYLLLPYNIVENWDLRSQDPGTERYWVTGILWDTKILGILRPLRNIFCNMDYLMDLFKI